MADLHERLEALGAEAQWPPEPDLAPRVRAAIEARPGLVRGRLRVLPAPLLATALLALVVAGGLAAAPGVRSELLQRLGLEHASVTRVERLPPTALGTRLDLGERFTLAAARERAGFALRMPAAIGTPGEVYLDGGLVTFVYGGRILFMQVPGSAKPFADKLSTRASKRVTVDGAPGLLVEGPHTVVFSQGRARQPRFEPSRLAQTTLLWERDGLLLRLEGDVPETELLRIARSVR